MKRWYRLTSDERKEMLDAAKGYFGEGATMTEVLELLDLHVTDQNKLMALMPNPAHQGKEPPPPSKPGKKARASAQELADDADRYLARLREAVTPEERADMLLEAARSSNPLMAARAQEILNELLLTKQDLPLAPLFHLPPGTALGFAPVVKEAPAVNLEEERSRVGKILTGFFISAPTDEESARWQDAIAKVTEG